MPHLHTPAPPAEIAPIMIATVIVVGLIPKI
jgi:hypothetical protein